ncbi:MAG: hypothetical protein HY785_25685 [Oscillatoriophycideae cyanobacterium NC_groundwater_1537_Pr4_S-0.65um_50_18]|nr:hypothetical protein [Oscillatoriophycideae cyanobacterium NC_groundwater_1537_Pr4_S-0.65um_50_18]
MSLWSLEKKEGKAVSAGKLSKHKALFEEMETAGTVNITRNSRYQYLSISDEGKSQLIKGLMSAEFSFAGTVVSSRESLDALELVIGQSAGIAVSNGNGNAAGAKVVEAIASYDEFKSVALEVFDQLNRDYNMDNLVPIYRIRREVGDRLSRAEFDEWLMEMQAQDICQLIGGEMPDITPEKAEDSIKTALGGLRYYVRHL